MFSSHDGRGVEEARDAVMRWLEAKDR